MRIIARLDWKPPYVIKPLYFDGLRKVGIASEVAASLCARGVDEIALINVVASLYQMKSPSKDILAVKENTEIPLAVGGGVSTIDEANRLLRNGADKIIVCSSAITNPELLKTLADELGNQSLAIHIQAKRSCEQYFAYYQCARTNSHMEVLELVRRSIDYGVGEIFLSDIDCDGSLRGPNLHLIESVVASSTVPVVAGSGVASNEDLKNLKDLNVSGVMIGSAFHYDLLQPSHMREGLRENYK